MYLYFGIVKNYLPEKGFGFIRHPLSLGPDYDVFFHITNAEKFDNQLHFDFLSYKSGDDICFWYISETTHKGEQLKKILSPDEVFDLQQENSNEFIEKIQGIWKSIEKPLPFWLSKVTIGLLGSNGDAKFRSEREELIRKRNKELEEQRVERERLKKIEEEKARIEREKRAEERRK